jgi:hypothetical protein
VRCLQLNFLDEQRAVYLSGVTRSSFRRIVEHRNAGFDLLTKHMVNSTVSWNHGYSDPSVWCYWHSDFRTCCVSNRSVSVNHDHGAILPWFVLSAIVVLHSTIDTTLGKEWQSNHNGTSITISTPDFVETV